MRLSKGKTLINTRLKAQLQEQGTTSEASSYRNQLERRTLEGCAPRGGGVVHVSTAVRTVLRGADFAPRTRVKREQAPLGENPQ